MWGCTEDVAGGANVLCVQLFTARQQITIAYGSLLLRHTGLSCEREGCTENVARGADVDAAGLGEAQLPHVARH